ncbi:MAG: hemerythrin domain-containing protein [Chloroflexi bacterium]|nr:hemerythrin domain-containing protein [Chloroflexota bacterium]OJW00772.1 MAG: hypothetical protein BGO39_20235 [Chloroflexi bacterium 54-19]
MTQIAEKKEELTGYILIHRAIERNLRLLEEHSRAQANPSTAKVQKIGEWWNLMWEIIEVHHVTEDKVAFPAYFERDAQVKGQMDGLTADHHVLDELTVQIKSCLAAALQPHQRQGAYYQYLDTLGRFNSLMFDHLHREEGIVLPTEASLFTREESAALEKRIIKNASMKMLALEGPFMFYRVDPVTEANFLKNLPLPIRLLYKFSWKGKYARRIAGYMAA